MPLVGRLQAQLRVERGAPAVRPAARLFREWQSAANCDAVVPPLQWVDLSCERTVGALCTMLARSDGARERHLREHVFPLCLRQHARHVSASGEQLGDTAVFGSCGTPSTLLRQVLLCT